MSFNESSSRKKICILKQKPVIEAEATTIFMQTKIKYRWNLEGLECSGLSPGKSLYSSTFSADSSITKWNLQLFPNGEKEADKEFISLFLNLVSSTRKITANCRLLLYNIKGVVLKSLSCVNEFATSAGKSGMGYKLFDVRKNVVGGSVYLICELSYDNEPVTVEQDTNINISASNELLADISSAQEMKKLSDVVLRVDGTDLPAHKVLLAVRSPVFQAMFEHNTLEVKENVIRIVDFDVETMREMLTFMYTGTAPNADKMAVRLLTVADKYDMPELKQVCGSILSQQLSIDNFCETFLFADLHHVNPLRDACIAFFRQHAGDVCRSEFWKTLKRTNASIFASLLEFIVNQEEELENV